MYLRAKLTASNSLCCLLDSVVLNREKLFSLFASKVDIELYRTVSDCNVVC